MPTHIGMPYIDVHPATIRFEVERVVLLLFTSPLLIQSPRRRLCKKNSTELRTAPVHRRLPRLPMLTHHGHPAHRSRPFDPWGRIQPRPRCQP
jgi:hypothetical protein